VAVLESTQIKTFIESVLFMYWLVFAFYELVSVPAAGLVDTIHLKLASDHLRADFDTVRLAVQKNGSALELASEDLLSNRAIVLAVQNYGQALLFCTNSSLLPDREFKTVCVP
jgi:hypothetical protein